MKMKKASRNKKVNIIIYALLTIIFLELILIINQSTAQQQEVVLQSMETPVPTAQGTPTTPPQPKPTETPYPTPTQVPTLRPIDCYDKSSNIWHPCNPPSYIEPDNEWVKYYASQLFIDYDGKIKYKDEKLKHKPLIYSEGTINETIFYYDYKLFVNNYVYDWEQFGTGSKGSLANDDYWSNVDYYLTHGMKGDCDEWANTITSMMLSGEISILNLNGYELIKQVIPSKTVLGYVGGNLDCWAEYHVYGENWKTSTSREYNPDTNSDWSTTTFIEKDNQFKGVFEFTNNITLREYHENWY